MKYILISLLCLLSACATQGIHTEVTKVEIPNATQCKTELPQTPIYSFPNVKPEDDIFDKVKILLSDIELYKAYVIELEAALNSCK